MKSKTNVLSLYFIDFFRDSYLLTNISLNGINFPTEKLRKNTGAQNTRAPIFFKINSFTLIIFPLKLRNAAPKMRMRQYIFLNFPVFISLLKNNHCQ